YGTALGVKLKSDIYDGAIAAIDDRSYKALNGEKRNAKIIVQNIGSLPIINAKIVLNLSAGLGSFTSTKAYDTYENGVVTYTTTVGAGLSYDFDITFLIDDEKDAFISAHLKLSDAQKDEDLSNNSANLNYQIGATQYNYKNCGNGKIISPTTSTLSYKIGFKNYNDRSVLAVKIVDEFDSDVTIKGKVNTITGSPDINVVNEWEIANNSHKVITTLTGLNLTPSGEDDANSNGFVEYHLDLLQNSLSKGMDICNTAKIYFSFSDGTFDEAMITNTVCSEVADILGIINNTQTPYYLNDLNIGPNPISNFITLENNSNKKYRIAVVNALGQELNSMDLNGYSKTVLDVKNLNTGLYTIYVDGIFAKKLVLTR
ncbi:MAG: T9SS type A sorting domain-containing protein, partial [Bacteroidetes bacterium]|nr:T9SS type A sorting domain-containing protein [Bacteroidota bacterium]